MPAHQVAAEAAEIGVDDRGPPWSIADLRRALRFIVPYWRRLALVLALSLASTALSLYLPLLSRDFFDRALIGRDVADARPRRRCCSPRSASPASSLNVVSGLRYTRVSADILFDMRLAMYRHLQRLSPRFYARTRLGDIMSRINNDIGEIQRDRRGDGAGLGRQRAVPRRQRRRCWSGSTARLFLVSAGDRAVRHLGAGRATAAGSRREVAALRQRSADIGSFLIETLQAMRLVVTSNAQEREVDALPRAATTRSSAR